jgi:hypothetical protein
LFDGICSVLNHIRPEWKKEKTELNVSLFEWDVYLPFLCF